MCTFVGICECGVGGKDKKKKKDCSRDRVAWLGQDIKLIQHTYIADNFR